ncbi:Smr/MutS family protein [Lentisphaera profundi]|uniref:Smr/MutS family protein n=1 Tax=Lentisphaera profundi TaxID=1658616 RepID=A0ABY7VXL4_9BACT|nr:Smr/MutS family protein [Lentisphaera profundi]WDE98852.1 Smr/MutS family protein [Lentisphaera profundi]
MDKLDLHELTVDEAVKCFIPYYNARVADKLPFLLIHGYGSTGIGGKIMRRLRSILEDNKDKMKFTFGEEIDGNPGYTTIYPLKSMAIFTDLLGQEILAFCESPKIQDKIIGKFRKQGQPLILKTLKQLENQKLIKSGIKGIYKTWHAI